MNSKERQYLAAVKSLPCCACGAAAPSSAHHIREGQGMAQKASHYLTIPLCYECHQGDYGTHRNRKQFAAIHGSELDLLAKTIERLYATQGEGRPESVSDRF